MDELARENARTTGVTDDPKAASHTPGPWDCWDMDEYGWHVFSASERETGQDYRKSIAAVRYGRSHPTTSANYHEGVANAHLIAAAPDLLHLWDDFPRFDGKESSGDYAGRLTVWAFNIRDRAAAALAKAEGL